MLRANLGALYLMYLFLPTTYGACHGCTVDIDHCCLPFDIGEDCIPDNYNDLVRDIKLYRAFFYVEATVIKSVRCLDYGVSVRHVPGWGAPPNISKAYFYAHYKGYFTRDCENWSFAPNDILTNI